MHRSLVSWSMGFTSLRFCLCLDLFLDLSWQSLRTDSPLPSPSLSDTVRISQETGMGTKPKLQRPTKLTRSLLPFLIDVLPPMKWKQFILKMSLPHRDWCTIIMFDGNSLSWIQTLFELGQTCLRLIMIKLMCIERNLQAQMINRQFQGTQLIVRELQLDLANHLQHMHTYPHNFISVLAEQNFQMQHGSWYHQVVPMIIASRFHEPKERASPPELGRTPDSHCWRYCKEPLRL